MAKKKSKSTKSSRVSLEKSDPSDLISRGEDKIHTPPAKTVAFLKLCRLCESKDGPFLSIFEDDKLASKKMDELLPFSVTENDGLPHKICFRCSAKVEELHEFVQKCKKSQENLQKAFGINTAVIKHNSRHIWEEKLIKSNMTNDNIIEKLVKKAMEDMKGSPTSEIKNSEDTPVGKKRAGKRDLKNSLPQDNLDEGDDVPLKQMKLNDKTAKKSSRSSKTTEPLNEIPLKTNKTVVKVNETTNPAPETAKKEFIPTKSLLTFDYDDNSDSSSNSKETKKNNVKTTSDTDKKNTDKKNEEKPFDIMDHVSTIKVNGVGILFQCKLCNRNFLKKEVVLVHGCAKTGIPKVDLTRHATPPPEPPKMPTVKYINTKTDGDLTRANATDVKASTPKLDEVKSSNVNVSKPKPRIGPASKVRKDESESNPTVGMAAHPNVQLPPTLTMPSMNVNSNSSIPAANIANTPFSLNSRYKLVPGPNNTITLVEDSNTTPATHDSTNKSSKKSKQHKKPDRGSSKPQINDEIIDLDDNEPIQPQNSSKPYPVNFFTSPQMGSLPEMTKSPQTNSQGGTKPVTEPVIPTPTFTTPAMKKQSYTIVQTGNPSKLLISTKPPPPLTPPVENTTPPAQPKRKTRKSKQAKEDNQSSNEPFRVTLEEASPPKDAGFFTYVNIDPLLQPAYGVPGDKIIQESQISTSSSVDKTKNTDGKYTCNMCNEVFTREKKLMTHIQAHYSKMDEEDSLRSNAKNTKTKRKSKRSTR